MPKHYDVPRYDSGGNPIPTPLQVKEEAIKNSRIAREQARIKEGFASQPVAGHDRTRELSRERGS